MIMIIMEKRQPFLYKIFSVLSPTLYSLLWPEVGMAPETGLKVYPHQAKVSTKSKKDQRTIRKDQKNAQQISKEIFAFTFAFTQCG